MTQFTIQSEGSPIIPYTLAVTFPVNHNAVYLEGVVSNLSGQDFIDQMQARASFVEDSVKTWAEYTIQDTNRNVTLSTIATGSPDAEGYTPYDLTISFTIENAEVSIPKEAQSELTGQDLTDFLQSKADEAAAEYFSGRPWTPIA